MPSISGHLGVAYVLFEALWRIQRTILAPAFALLFVALAANFQMVTWHHLGGYMLGYAALDEYLRPHLEKPGFAFAVRGVPAELNPIWKMPVGYADQQEFRDVSTPKLLYGKYYDEASSGFIIDLHPGGVNANRPLPSRPAR